MSSHHQVSNHHHHHHHHPHHHHQAHQHGGGGTSGPGHPHDPGFEAEPWQDCRCSEPVRACLGNTSFLLVTLVMIGDIFTDVWVTVLLALRGEMVLAGLSVLFLVTTSLIVAFMYAVQIKYETTGSVVVTSTEQPAYHVPGCLLLNVPFQLGIIGHRLKHFGHRSKQCCTIIDQRNINNMEWTFAKLKLAQSVFQSSPMLITNIYAMLIHYNSHGVNNVQYFSAAFSFLSLVFGAVNHEKVRKERVRHVRVGVTQITCIFTYKTLMLTARILALVNFLYFYHELLAVILIPHFLIVFVFFAYVYRAVWKVRYYKIFMHAIYCILAYFPIHNDYRPEGEILLYYTLFIIENIIMVSVPYALKTMQARPRIHLPGSQYYYVITICVLVGSAVGLCFMAVYYFLLHRSKATIQEQHLNWLSRFCIWSNKEEDAPVRPMTTQASPDGSRLLASQHEGSGSGLLLMGSGPHDENVEHEHLLTVVQEVDESAPPSAAPIYRASMTPAATCPHHGHLNTQISGALSGRVTNNIGNNVSGDNHHHHHHHHTPNTTNSSLRQDTENSAVNEGANKNTTVSNQEAFLKRDGSEDEAYRNNTSRSSVLSGDEDIDSDQDADTRPLHVIV